MANAYGCVDQVELRYGYFPRRFVWRGRRYEVLAVRGVESARRDWLRPARRRRYDVETAEGRFSLDHDLIEDRWQVLWAPAEAGEGRGAAVAGRMAYGERLALVRQ